MNIATTFSLKNKKRLANRGRKQLRRFLTPNMIPGLVLLGDAAIIISAGLASVALYLVPAHGEVAVGPHYVIALVLGAMLQIQFSYSSQHFDLSQLSATGQQLQRVVLIWTVSLLVITAFFFLLQIGDRFSRGWLIVWYISALFGLLAFRFRLPLLLRRLRLAGLLTRQAIVVGPQSQLDALRQRLDCAKGAANFDITMLAFEYQDQSDASLRQRIDQTKAEIRKRSIDCVCILSNSDQSTYLHILATELSELPADVVFCSVPFVDLPLRGLMTIHSLPVLRLHDKPLKDWQALLKIIEDRLLATLMLLLFAPVMFLIAVAVKLDSPGPVFFRQARFGFNNTPFQAYKFRSMYVDKGDVTGAQRTLKNDPRVTVVGRFLRKTSLDELPQLINVLRGEMSIVGPRAHPVHMMVGDQYYHDAVQRYLSRHRVKPGITGWAQINGLRGAVDNFAKAQRRVEYDLYYIDKWSIWFDIRIIMVTLFKGFASRDAF